MRSNILERCAAPQGCAAGSLCEMQFSGAARMHVALRGTFFLGAAPQGRVTFGGPPVSLLGGTNDVSFGAPLWSASDLLLGQ